MAYGDFIQLQSYVAKVQDVRFYGVEFENPTLSSEFEGGYEATRPQHFRAEYRRSFTTGWTDMTSAEKISLEYFYKLTNAGASIFIWVNPFESYSVPYGVNPGDTFVRFVDGLRFTPKSYGGTLLWDCQIKIREV